MTGALDVIRPCTNPATATVQVTLAQDHGGMTVSPTTVPCRTVTLVVMNIGTIVDDLHVFADFPHSKGATSEIQPGQTARLTITFIAKGVAYLESGDYPPAEPEFGGDFGEEGHVAIV